MILLREEQIKEKIDEAVDIVGHELEPYKGNYSPGPISKENIFSDDFSLEFLRPATIGKRFTAAELNEKIRLAFKKVDLKKMHFEFVLANLDPRTNLMGKIERQSDNFARQYNDTVNNYSKGYFLITPSGSAAENLATDETLIVVGLDYKSFAFQSLRLRIITAV